MASLLQGLQGIPGLPAAPAPVAANPLGAIAGPTVAPVAAQQPQSPFQGFLTGGVQMPKFVLVLLTMFPPTGIVGLNLNAVENIVGMIIKSLSYGVGILWGMYFNRVYPSTVSNIISILMFIGPWFLFDIFTILDSKFLGFKPPISIPGYQPLSGYPGVERGATWKLSPALMGLIATTIPAGIAGATGIANYYSPNAVSSDTQKYISYGTIGVAALVGGFSLFSLFRTPAAAAVAPPSVLPPPLQGGGSRAPSLSQIARELSRPIHARGNTESQSFVGILAIVFLGGLAIAVTRAKQAAPQPLRGHNEVFNDPGGV